MFQRTTQASLSLCVLLGTLISVPFASAHAQTDDSQKVAFFEANCGHSGIEVSQRSFPQDQVPDHPEPSAVRPQCTVSGHAQDVMYQCVCEDSDKTIAQAMDPSPFFPNSPQELDHEAVSAACETAFERTCGPFATPIEVECGGSAPNEPTCHVGVEGEIKDGGHNVFTVDCECSPDVGWGVGVRSSKEQSYDESQAAALCQSQLRSCDGSSPLGPDDAVSSLVPQSDVVQLEATCAAPAANPDAEPDHCSVYLPGIGQDLQIACECGDGSTIEGGATSPDQASMDALYKQCTQNLKLCRPEPSPQPKAPKLPDVNLPGQVGCSAGSFGQPAGLMGAGLILGLGLVNRRRRSRKTN